MTRREWRIVDAHGARWRLRTEGKEGLSADQARSALTALLFASLHRTPNPNDRVSATLIEIHNELANDSVSHREWASAELGEARRIAGRVSRSLESAVRTGALRIDRDVPAAVDFELDDAPDTIAAARPSAVESVKTWIGITVKDESGEPVDGRSVELTFAEGSSRTVTLTQGRIDLQGIPLGTVKIRFVDIDKKEIREGA